MNTPVGRFKKRKAVLEGKTISNMPIDAPQPSLLTEATAHSFVAVRLNDEAELISAEADTLLAEIHGRIDDEKFSALIEACQQECLQAVIRPFGLARLLFVDKEGGPVDTIHNVRTQSKDRNGRPRFLSEEKKTDKNGQLSIVKREFIVDKTGKGIYLDDGSTVSKATIKKNSRKITVYATSKEQEAYEERGEYNSVTYHQDNRYIAANAETSDAQKAGVLIDSYGDQVIGPKEKNLDHVKSAKENHEDAGRILAGIKGEDLASLSSNLKATTETINKSKKQKSVDEFISWVDKIKIPTLKDDIARLEGKASPSGDDLKDLAKCKSDLEKFAAIDRDKMRAADKAARKEIESKINKTYYKSKKFITNTALTSLNEGGKMALQQAIGVLMEEFVRAAFAEVKDAWRNGFKGCVDDAFLDALKVRLMRIAKRVQSKWKGAASAAINGGISGFLSNLVTVIINIFTTTEAQVARMLREGFMSLYRALKILAFPPEGLSLAQAADAASKLFAAGLITGAGIGLEVVLEAHLTALGPLAPYVSSIGAGVITGLSTAFVVYMLDRLDLFGVNAQSRHEHVVAKLNDMISISYEHAVEAASVFDGPNLLHLT
jgi:hypothetical protein